MKLYSRIGSLLEILIFVITTRAYAQSISGDLVVRVSDASKATIVGAKLKLTEVRTKINQSSVTDWLGTPLFEYVRSKLGFTPKLCHNVHSHLSGINAVEFSRCMQPCQMFFIEDVLSPEQLAWYKQIRQITTTPQAVEKSF